MIQERRCSYEVARLLKEKGFDVKCTDWFWENNINIWKPTEKQINAIRLARSFVADDSSDNPTLSEILTELEEQLRNLI